MSTNSPSISNSSIQAPMESASFPTTPVFDTDSNASDASSQNEHSPGKQLIIQQGITHENLNSFQHAKIRVISGRFTGLTGKIGRIVNNGWLYVDNNPKICRPIRWGDVEVLKLANGICSHAERNLMAARIRINDGRHCGLEGVIVEKRVGLSFKLDSLYGIPLRLEDVTIVRLGRRGAATSLDPHKKYMGAFVEVLGGEHLGMSGQVVKVIQEVYYVTDNGAIEQAYKRKQFDVLTYADETTTTTKDHCDGGCPEGDDNDDRNNGEDYTYLRKGKSLDPKYNPFIGLLVYVGSNPHKGHMGRVLETNSRGWWKLDNLNVMVKSNQLKIVDDGRKIDTEAIREYYSRPGRLIQRMPPLVKLGQETEGGEDDVKEEMGDVQEEKRDEYELRMSRSRNSYHLKKRRKDYERFQHKVYETDFIGPRYKGEDAERESVIRWGCKPATHLAISNVPELNDKRSRRYHVRGSSVPVLDPILVRTNESYLVDHEKNAVMLQLAPDEISHLPTDTKIEIFNRRTGKIMRGDAAISLSELPVALMDHAEYEPIVPPPANTKISSRIGRSGRNIRVNNKVVPQCPVRGSVVEGKHVLVTGGEYRGLTGFVKSCIPGGWYVLSKMFKYDNLDLDVIVSSANLEIIPEKVVWSQPLLSGDDTTKERIHLKALMLRLDALRQEKIKYLSSTPEDPAILKLDGEIYKLSADIEQNQNDLQMSESSS